MFRRIKGLVILLTFLCITGVAGASAYFYFGGTSNQIDESIDNESESAEDSGQISADNILENYEFGAVQNLNDTYTYYFFPSTLYMELYNQGYTSPETVFGYNEVILDDNGDPALTIDNQPRYSINKENISGVYGSNTYYSYLADNLNHDSSHYLYPDIVNTGNYNYASNSTQVFAFGNSIMGDDYNVNGLYFPRNDIYALNNTGADLILNSADLFSNYAESHVNYSDWTQFTYNFNRNGITYTNETEVLSPTYDSSDYFDINLNFTEDSKLKEIYNLFINFYQYEVGDNRISGYSGISGTLGYNYNINTSNHDLFYPIDATNQKYRVYQIDSASSEAYLDYGFIGSWDYGNGTISFQEGAYNSEDELYHGNGFLREGSNNTLSSFTYIYNSTTNILDIDASGTSRDGQLTFNKCNFDDPYASPIMARAQYRNDRFGFWTSFYDWDDPRNANVENKPVDTASRYLPIKIEVNGNLTPDDMARVIPSISASTFDSHRWFDYTSNVWTYTTGGNLEYTTAVGGFTAKDVTNIFDIMQNPEKYADTNNVIRLYPIFNNGKNYATSSFSDGGADGIKAEFVYNDTQATIENSLLPYQTKLTYASKSYRYTVDGGWPDSWDDDTTYSLNYAVLKNIELVRNRYKSITISVAPANRIAGWSSSWFDAYVLSGKAINSFINTYGEGLYTIYFFIGDRGGNHEQDSSVFGVTNVINHVTNDNSNNNDLKNKYLMSIYDNNGTMQVSTNNNGFLYLSGNGNNWNIGNNARPVGLTIEKVTNFRLVSDIPIVEDSDGVPSNNQNWANIDQNVQEGLLHAENFMMADSVYSISEDQFEEESLNYTDISSQTPLDSDNPYIYLIRNADFRFVNNLYFQIRFANDYINNALTVNTSYDSVNQVTTPKYVAYRLSDQSNELLKFEFQDKDIFIDNAGPISGTDSQGNISQRSGFKLRDYNARGVYDILLVATGNDSGMTRTFNMYINRHTNSFIKLFNGNPGTFAYTIPKLGTNETSYFVRHKLPSEDPTGDQVRDKNSTLLWNGQAYLGENLSTSSEGIPYTEKTETTNEAPITGESKQTFIDAVKEALGVTPGVEQMYPIKDAVTNQTIAYYNSGVGRIFTSAGSTGGTQGESVTELDLFVIMKNYVLYIDEPINQVA